MFGNSRDVYKERTQVWYRSREGSLFSVDGWLARTDGEPGKFRGESVTKLFARVKIVA